MTVQLIGLDWAVDAKNVGIAIGEWNGKQCHVCSTKRGKTGDQKRMAGEIANQVIAELDRNPDRPAILAIDAPLGWPAALAASLQFHHAGSALSVFDADLLFMRETDLFLMKKFPKNEKYPALRPLSIGADRIARTAKSALDFLATLRSTEGGAWALLWAPAELSMTGVIEVYPAATLRAHGIPSTGYKGTKDEARKTRESIVERLQSRLGMPDDIRKASIDNDHQLDAVVCLLAASDFLAGRCFPPPPCISRKNLRREGWIQARAPKGTQEKVDALLDRTYDRR